MQKQQQSKDLVDKVMVFWENKNILLRSVCLNNKNTYKIYYFYLDIWSN